MQTIKAIQTFYKGYHFRSRLEARWAVFFDEIGIVWEYEKEGFEFDEQRYLPDFWLPLPSDEYPDAGYWVEIKGRNPSNEEISKLLSLTKFTKHTGFILVGLPGDGLVHATHHIQGYRIIRLGFVDKYMTDEHWGLMGFLTRFPCSGGNLKSAVNAARSARFEHGESGATFRG